MLHQEALGAFFSWLCMIIPQGELTPGFGAPRIYDFARRARAAHVSRSLQICVATHQPVWPNPQLTAFHGDTKKITGFYSVLYVAQNGSSPTYQCKAQQLLR